MFVSIGYLMLGLTRWIRAARRHVMYLHTIRQVFRGSSVFVQRSHHESRISPGSLIRSPLLNGSLQFRDRVVLQDDYMTVVTIDPLQRVDLEDWTSYYRPQGAYLPDSSGDDVMVLIDAVRPTDLDSFVQHEAAIAPAQKVHVLAHGAAVAWRAGTPFGILLHCTLDEFVTLAMAFVDGSLTLDEDLEVNTLLTVKTTGQSSSLVLQQEIETDEIHMEGATQGINKSKNAASNTDKTSPPGSDDMDHLRADFARTLAGHLSRDQLTDLWSNESLASNSSLGRVVELSDNDILDAESETGAGEGLSEMELEVSSNSGSLTQSWKFVRSISVTKPPNILIYSGKIDLMRKFNKGKRVLEQCLDTECYAIYNLKHEEIETTPWVDNTALLVITTRKRYTDANEAFLRYFMNGGKILAIGSGFDGMLIRQKELRAENWVSEQSYRSWSNVPLASGRFAYNTNELQVDNVTATKLGTDKDNNVTIVKIRQSSKGVAGCAILSQVLFDKDAVDLGVTPEIFNRLKQSNVTRFEILAELLTSFGLECNPRMPPALTPAQLITKTQDLHKSFLHSIESRLVSGVLKCGGQSLLFTTNKEEPVQDNLLPVITEDIDSISTQFDRGCYLGNLDTRVLGNTVFYVDVIPTTMTLFDGLMFSVPSDVGMIAIARQQTSGRGRGGNSWLSPVGCGMFSLHVQIALDSPLGHSVSYLQHITSLAIVYSVCKLDGYQDIDLRLKWPNDVYYSREMKLGGVIVKSTIMDGVVHATIGCGFNVDNSNPTICINDLIQLQNRQQGTNLASCSCEQLIGRTVSYIEKLIDQFQRDGVDTFRQLYYDKWLHSDSVVRLQSEGDMEVTITGLDDYGYLQVETPGGEKLSVQPDGNSFDMMQNLIVFKTR